MPPDDSPAQTPPADYRHSAPAPPGYPDQETDEVYFSRRTAEELERAARSSDGAVKRIHLDMASRYATRSELAKHKTAYAGHE
jgi:hypothetical protein